MAEVVTTRRLDFIARVRVDGLGNDAKSQTHAFIRSVLLL